MSSFYEDASLVVIPSGYKTSKIYAEKPTDGSGDLTFTRASGATRVASNGLIEKVRTNQVLQSETLENAYWSKINVSVTANAIANPVNGATTADLLTVTDPSGPVEKTIATSASQAFTAGVPYTASAYFKAGSITTTFRILAYDGTTIYTSGTIDLATIGSSTAPYVSLGNGWYRFSFTFTPSNSTSSGYVYFVNYAFGVAANAGTNVYVYGTQIEAGDIATAYIPTTTAAVSVGPVSNVPRLDYLGSTCPRLLLEPQRTNIVPYSEQLNNAAWTKLETNITANDAVSPDGYTNADKFIANTNNAAHLIYQSVASGTYTFSIYAKAAGENVFSMWLNDFSKRALFDLSSGTVTTSNVTSSSITSVGNGWYRCTVYDTSTTSFVAIYGRNAESYAGNGTSGFLFWGAQCEAGAYATSYIPTTAASVTRVADTASKTGISSLIGQTEGTLFVDFNYLGNIGATASVEAIPLYVGAGAFTDAIYFTVFQTNLYLVVWVGSVNQVTLNLGSISAGKHKASLSYIANDFKVYFDGVLAGTDTSGSIPSLSAVYFGTAGTSTTPEAISVNQALIFKTRLTNAQLAELTTL
jgi:hypothetical protein